MRAAFFIAALMITAHAAHADPAADAQAAVARYLTCAHNAAEPMLHTNETVSAIAATLPVICEAPYQEARLAIAAIPGMATTPQIDAYLHSQTFRLVPELMQRKGQIATAH